jgi:hypothetical protein
MNKSGKSKPRTRAVSRTGSSLAVSTDRLLADLRGRCQQSVKNCSAPARSPGFQACGKVVVRKSVKGRHCIVLRTRV